VLELRDGTRKINNQFNHLHGPTLTKQQVSYCIIRTFWCTNQPLATMDSQESPWPRLRGSQHLPPYSIFMCLATGPPHKSHFVLRLPSGNPIPKFLKLGLPQLWGPITLCADLRLKWGLKQSCNPCWELSKGMSQATYTQGNWGDSCFLVVGSQINNFVPSLLLVITCVLNVQMGHASPF